MAEYVCSNCAEKSKERKFNVPFILSSCDNPKCDFEPYINMTNLSSLSSHLKSKLSSEFKKRHISSDSE